MHVLGLPPAFVLSQDQTLKLKSCCQLILDVRTSAHLHREANPRESLCLSVLQVSSETESRTNSEADTGSSAEAYQRDIQKPDPSNEPNRPHISSSYHQCQRAAPGGQKQDRCANPSARPPLIPSRCPPSLRGVLPSLRPVPPSLRRVSQAPQQRR